MVGGTRGGHHAIEAHAAFRRAADAERAGRGMFRPCAHKRAATAVGHGERGEEEQEHEKRGASRIRNKIRKFQIQ